MVEEATKPTLNGSREQYRLETLHDSEELYRALVEFAPDAIVVQSRGRYIYANQAALRLFGASRQEEVIGKDVLEFIHPEHRAFIAERIRQTTEKGVRNFRRESEILRLDGTTLPVEVAGTRFLYDGHPASHVFLRDITERKRAEEIQRESEAFVRRVLDSLFAFVGVLTPEGVLIQANRAALEAANLKLEDVLGRAFHQTYWWAWSCDVQDQLCAAIKRAADGDSSRFDVVVRLGPRRFVPIDFMLSPMRDQTGCVTHLIPSAVPIEERKQMEEELRKAKHDLEDRVMKRTAELSLTVQAVQAEIARRTLAEQALLERSEQLRALASQLALAEQHERRRVAQILHDDLQQLLVGAKFRIAPLERNRDKHVRRMALEVQDLIDHSLEVSRSLTGELCPPILGEGGLIPALEWLSRWMREKHNLRVETEIDILDVPETEDLTSLLFQAVRELLFNVVKHANTDNARVKVERIEDQIRITVADKGAGFEMAELSPKGTAPGGFGLFSIRERLLLVGGNMEIDSAPGNGCRISLRIPIVRAGLPESPAASQDAAAAVSERISLPGPRKVSDVKKRIRVLLADDHTVMRQGLSRLLAEEENIEVVGQASDGEEAVILVRQVQPDVVLMDVSMPRMNGVQATHIIHEEFPQVKVIGLSMFEEVERATAMREAGAVDYLTKSGPSDTMIKAILNSVGSSGSYRESDP